MQTEPRAYPISAVIAVLGLVALLVGFVVMLLVPSLRPAAWAILALGVLLLAVAFVIDFRRVRGALGSKRGRFGTGATVMVSVFLGITLLVNLISITTYHRFDLTGVSQFTLTSQTKEILSELETPVQALLFSPPEDPYGVTNYITNILTEYQNYTDQLNLEDIDPDEHPDQARQYGVNVYPTVVFESQDLVRLVSPQAMFPQVGQQIVDEAEHAFTSAILEVTGIVQKKVYFLTGHGEANIGSFGSRGYSKAAEGLRDNLYKVEKPLNLMITPSIPEDCAVLIIAGPTKALASNEVAVIARYLENGGRVMILTNPASSPEIGELLAPWGVEIKDGTVIDPASYVSPSIDSPMVPRTRNALGLPEMYFPGATAIIPQPGYTPAPFATQAGTVLIIWMSEDSRLMLNSLVRTSQDSWLERDFNSREEPEFDEGRDLEGPLNIAFLITTVPPGEAEEQPEEEAARLVVIGDSDFASNQHFYNANNKELFLTSVNVLTAGTEIISIDRKVLPFRRLVIGQEEQNLIKYSSMILLPLLVLVVGGVMWWRRR